MSSIAVHASCHGNRSGEDFLKDPVKHLEREEERKQARCVADYCPFFHPRFFTTV